MYNHYFYDYQGEIVAQWLQYTTLLARGKSVLMTDNRPAVYMIQAEIHIQGETSTANDFCWLVNRLSKIVADVSYIDTTSPRQPLPLKSVQAFRQTT